MDEIYNVYKYVMLVHDLSDVAVNFTVIDALTMKVLYHCDGKCPGDIPFSVAIKEVHRIYAKNDEIIVEVVL